LFFLLFLTNVSQEAIGISAVASLAAPVVAMSIRLKAKQKNQQ